MCWVDIPGLSARIRYCPVAWQQCTSVYLDDSLQVAVKASGVPLTELIRRGPRRRSRARNTSPSGRGGHNVSNICPPARRASLGVLCTGSGCYQRDTARYGLRRLVLCAACAAALRGQAYKRETSAGAAAPSWPGCAGLTSTSAAAGFMSARPRWRTSSTTPSRRTPSASSPSTRRPPTSCGRGGRPSSPSGSRGRGADRLGPGVHPGGRHAAAPRMDQREVHGARRPGWPAPGPFPRSEAGQRLDAASFAAGVPLKVVSPIMGHATSAFYRRR